MRLLTRRLPLLLATTVAATTAVAVTPAVTPAGAATTTYAVTHAMDPRSAHSIVVRWTACQTISGVTATHYITYRVNTGGSSARVKLVQQALARVTTASGLRFRYLGTTIYVPHYAVLHYPTGNRLVFNAAQQRRATGAELVVGWVSGTKSNLFQGREAGVGTVSWTGGSTSTLRIVEGAALLKLGVPLRAGFTTGASVGSLLQHEIGHAVGLDHVGAQSQIMYPVLGSYTPSAYGSGDRTGLRLVGRAAGCFTTKALAPPDPALMARAAHVSVTL
jgi:hypothetical protein